MGFINNDGVVTQQQRIMLGLGQQNPVGHQFDQGRRAALVGEAHLIAHLLAQRDFQLFRQATGDTAGSQATRLGVAN